MSDPKTPQEATIEEINQAILRYAYAVAGKKTVIEEWENVQDALRAALSSAPALDLRAEIAAVLADCNEAIRCRKAQGDKVYDLDTVASWLTLALAGRYLQAKVGAGQVSSAPCGYCSGPVAFGSSTCPKCEAPVRKTDPAYLPAPALPPTSIFGMRVRVDPNLPSAVEFMLEPAPALPPEARVLDGKLVGWDNADRDPFLLTVEVPKPSWPVCLSTPVRLVWPAPAPEEPRPQSRLAGTIYKRCPLCHLPTGPAAPPSAEPGPEPVMVKCSNLPDLAHLPGPLCSDPRPVAPGERWVGAPVDQAPETGPEVKP